MTEKRRSMLLELIEYNPGLGFRQIMRASGMKNGVLSHYLDRLEKNGAIKAVRSTRQVRFYAPKITHTESVAIKALRRQTPKDLLLALLRTKNGMYFSELVVAVKKSPSTVSTYLAQIIKDGLVETKLVNMRKRYYVQQRGLLDRLIEKYKPSFFERSVSGFEDIMNAI